MRNNKELYKEKVESFVQYTDEQLNECIESFKSMVSKHKDCQALVARNIGKNVDLCYILWKDQWILVGDLRVSPIQERGFYMSSEGSYDVPGRFKVKRARDCKYSFVKLTANDNGSFEKQHMEGKANGNISRVLQRMYTDNNNEPIWVLGKKYLPVDPVRYGLLRARKTDTTSIMGKIASFFMRKDN